ncbi:MAG TPA: AI-2E family transporter YdiK [Casimicrobiaceae bacterium]|nr:AI-2E family transporter YdiK [Casimicrobiaceae bacterium]
MIQRPPARYPDVNGSAAPPRSRDVTLTVLAVLLIIVLIAASFWVLRPFLLPLIWTTMIVVATWPLMLKVQAAVRRRSIAVTLMSGAMLVIFVAPLALAILTVLQNVDGITSAIHSFSTATLPPPPEWIEKVPLVGKPLSERWLSFADAGHEQLSARIAPYATDAAQWLVTAFGSIGMLMVQFLLTLVLSIVMFARGEVARDALLRFGRRLAGERGEGAVILAGQAIRSVALGVVVTALAQTTLAGLGLAVAGIPYASLLTGIILLLCIAQVGPILVLVPCVIWLFSHDANGWGSALLVWTLFVGALDNVLRPILIRRGADLPLLLIFAGVIGGLIAFGIVGLFVGPVVLAVAYTLLRQWVAEGDAPLAEQPAVSRRVRAAS